MANNKPSIFVGDTFKTRCGECKVICYTDSSNVSVLFEDGTEVCTYTSSLRKGNVKNPNYPSVYGKGYFGVGDYSSEINKVAYQAWGSMLERCYDLACQLKRPSYVGCSVHQYWLNFQNFAKDYATMLGNEKGWQLDKDVLTKGNKIYSFNNCVLLPTNLNNLLLGSNSSRGKFPIGVSYHKRHRRFTAQVSDGNGKGVWLGSYSTPESAFAAYKKFKEAFVKQQALIWKDQIDPRAYEALMNYEVLITD